MRLMQKRYMVVASLVALAVLSLTSSVFAQQREVRRTWGLSGSIQGSQTAILVPLWMGDTMILAPGLSLSYREGVGTTLGVMIVPRFYLGMARVVPYIPLNAGLLFTMPKGGGDTTDLQLGAGIGGEYFINPRFSLAVEARLNGQVLDLSGGNTIALQTATAVIVNVYF